MRGLIAFGIACSVAICALVVLGIVLPEQGNVEEGVDYGYVYSGVKSESVDFSLAASDADTYFLFGSSELATMPEMVTTAPDRIFREYDCGMQLMYVGEAYDQSLWMSLAAGAYARDMPNKKVGIIISPQWFFDGGLEPGIFRMRFSYNLYQRFCANESISPETKDAVATRLLEEGVDRALVDAARPVLPQDYLNGVVFSAMHDMKLRESLGQVREMGSTQTAPTGGAPDFAALREQARLVGQSHCTNNEYGMFDFYWSEFIEPEYAARKNMYASETLTQTPEYDDFSRFLDVCAQTGLEPLVIIMPTNGSWYDYAGLSSDVRKAFYGRIVSMCADRGVECLDLSPHEYEKYYMRDAMHFGWLGWLDVEEGLMNFVRGKSDD